MQFLDPNSQRHWDRVYCEEVDRGLLRQDTGLLKHIGLFEGRRLITDFGSGPGGNVKLLSERLSGRLFTLVDHSEFALNHARSHLPTTGIDNEYRFLSDMKEIEPGSQDMVICIEVLEHLREYRAILDALWEKLAPGGLLLISVPVKGWRDRHREHVNKFTLRTMFALLSLYSDWVCVAARSFSGRTGKLSTAYFTLTKPMER